MALGLTAAARQTWERPPRWLARLWTVVLALGIFGVILGATSSVGSDTVRIGGQQLFAKCESGTLVSAFNGGSVGEIVDNRDPVADVPRDVREAARPIFLQQCRDSARAGWLRTSWLFICAVLAALVGLGVVLAERAR